MSDTDFEVRIACTAVTETRHDWTADCTTRWCNGCGREVWVTRWVLAEIAREYPTAVVGFVCRECGRPPDGQLEGGSGPSITPMQLARWRDSGMSDEGIAQMWAASTFGYGLSGKVDDEAILRRLDEGVAAIGTDDPAAEVGERYLEYVLMVRRRINEIDGTG